MAELGLTWTENGIDLGVADPIETAVLISLFADARSEEMEPRRGFWGDALDGSRTGSRLWLLDRSKLVPETLRQFEDYVREALAWLDDVSVTASVDRAKRLGLNISVRGRVFRFGGRFDAI